MYFVDNQGIRHTRCGTLTRQTHRPSHATTNCVNNTLKQNCVCSIGSDRSTVMSKLAMPRLIPAVSRISPSKVSKRYTIRRACVANSSNAVSMSPSTMKAKLFFSLFSFQTLASAAPFMSALNLSRRKRSRPGNSRSPSRESCRSPGQSVLAGLNFGKMAWVQKLNRHTECEETRIFSF